MRSLANGLITYTESQARELRVRNPTVLCTAAPNSLYSQTDMTPATSSGEVSDVIYVGRLADNKKPRLLIDGFLDAAPALPTDATLKIIGDGPLLSDLRQEFGKHPRIQFLGYISNYSMLRTHYGSALCSISPSYVGLSVTQSLGFGVPVVFPVGELHSPEAEALSAGNSITFMADDPRSMGEAILELFADKERWLVRRAGIAADTRLRYSAEAMATGFLTATLESSVGRPQRG